MTQSARSLCENLCATFVGRRAIYLEKFACLVKVTDIAYDLRKRIVTARVETIDAPGMEGSHRPKGDGDYRPMRWKITAGYLTRFSEHTWKMGYGGWSMYFSPEIVESVLELAAGWDPSLHIFDKYGNTLRALEALDAHKPTRRIFPAKL